MNELFCPYCKAGNLYPLLNGEYRCNHCFRIIGVAQMEKMRDILIEKMREVEKLTQPGMCGRCGRRLSDPGWCSWCGKEPASPEAALQELRGLKERMYAIKARIEAGEPAEYRQARAGIQPAISHVFERAVAHAYEWKTLIDLGTVAAQFLVSTIKKGSSTERAAAISALFQIVDLATAESMLEAILKDEPSIKHAILNDLQSQSLEGTPLEFSILFDALKELSSSGKERVYDLEKWKGSKIIAKLKEILEHSGSIVPAGDLLAASTITDLSVTMVTIDYSKTYMDEDPWGYLGNKHPENESNGTIDCSSLRQAAQKEIERRAKG
jgi:hypothetical protein